MRILHFADLHLDPATRDNTRPALRRLVEAVQREKPDLVVNAGDLSMKRGHLAPWVALELREAHVAMSRVCPVIVVAGNHDLAGGTEVGTVFGALKAANSTDLYLYEKPGAIDISGRHVACIPYPSRHELLARFPDLKADEIDGALSTELHNTLDMVADGSEILIFHGSIAGAATDSEQIMSTEIDMVLVEDAVPSSIRAILCGHIHRAQEIGRAAYPGSPAPLNFGETRSEHGYLVWDDAGGKWSRRFVPLEVEHPLVTLDWRESRNGVPDVTRARVRVMLSIPRHEDTAARRAAVTAEILAAGAHEVRCVIERPDQGPLRGPEVRADWSLERLIALYCEQTPEAQPIAAALEEVAIRINESLPIDYQHEAFAGYELDRLWWKNWKSLSGGELKLSDLGPLTAIEGPNGAGKSNVAEVEAFALYGRTPRGSQPLGEMVRQGERTAIAACEITAAGARWKVERRIKVSTKGVGAAELALFRQEQMDTEQGSGLAWAPASAGTARETQALIERLVGPWELYPPTRFASQGDIDRLLDLTPADLKDTLQATLGVRVYEAREAVGAGMLRQAEKDLSDHTAGLAAWTAEAGTLPDRKVALANSESAAKAARTALAEAKAEEGRMSERVREIGERRARLAEEVQRYTRALADATEAEKQAASLKASLDQLRAELHLCAAAKDKAAQLPALRAQLDEHLELKEIRLDMETALAAAQAALADVEKRASLEADNHRQAADRLRFEVVRREQAVKEAVRILEAGTRQWNERLEEVRRAADGLVLVPFGEKCVTAKCPLVAGAVSAREALPGLEERRAAEIAAAEAGVALASEERAETREEQARLEAAWGEMRPLLAEEVSSARRVVTVKREALQALPEADPAAIRARIVETEAHVATAVRAKGLETTIAELEPHAAAALRRSVDTRAQVPTPPDGEELDAELELATRRHNECVVREGLRREDLDVAVRAAAEAQVRVEAALAAQARLDTAAADGAALADRVEVLRAHQRMVGRDGLPYLMLQRSLPALEMHANHFLCDDMGAGRRVEIEPLREMRDGSQKAEVVIRYRNDFGLHSLAAASGFERVAIGYALRAALAQVMAEAQGVTVGHWWADEGWGVFDDIQIVTVGQPMLRRLAERFGRVLLISHQAPIREVCDTRLCVVPDYDKGSRLESVA
jgi:DNA repair exonuclease SbcCD ATPase subunit/DNA repair exonuclease SbcCD nuclease subunit